MKHFLLFYQAGADYGERRTPFRPAHLAHAKAAVARGEMLLAGAYADPLDGSVFLFQGADRSAAEAFAAADPYVTAGIIERWWVREWTTVLGQWAAQPV